MSVRTLDLSGPAGLLEAELTLPEGVQEGVQEGEVGGVAVLAHPHPLYGGSMRDAVLDAAAGALLARGTACLRFNFRGVGRSAGEHDHGEGETDDFLAVVQAARLAVPGAPLLIGGYSFGAFVAWRASHVETPARILLIAPPVGVMTFSGDLPAGTTLDVVFGDRDDFAPEDSVRLWAGSLRGSVRLHRVAEADHFFRDRLDRLADAVRAD